MSKPESLVSVTLPTPTGGLDFFSPLAAMGQSNSPWMVNVDADNRVTKVRNGYRIHATIAGTTSLPGTGISSMASYNNILFVAYCTSSGPHSYIYQVTTGGVVSTAFHDTTNAFTYSVPHGIGGDLVFCANTSAAAPNNVSGWRYDASSGTWGTWELYYDGTRTALGVYAWFKGRIYCVRNNVTGGTSDILYGDVGQIQGEITNVPFAGGTLFEFNSEITWMGKFSISSESENLECFAFGNSVGEVLVYSGESPLADDWQLVQALRIPTPRTGRIYDAECTFQYENDILVFTVGGIVSIKNLFVNKDKPGLESHGYISQSINPHWSKLLYRFPNTSGTSYNGRGVSAALHEVDRTIYILVQGWINQDDTWDSSASTMFLYNLNSLAWSMHKITAQSTTFNTNAGPGHVCYCDGDIYFWTGQYVMKLDRTSWLDQEVTGALANTGYDVEIDSAPMVLDNSIAVKVLQLFQPIVVQRTSETSPVRFGWGIKTCVDFGRKETGLSSPAAATDFANQRYSQGAEGTFFQYKIRGNTATTSGETTTSLGMELYAMNAFYKRGGAL